MIRIHPNDNTVPVVNGCIIIGGQIDLPRTAIVTNNIVCKTYEEGLAVLMKDMPIWKRLVVAVNPKHN